ncbi:5-oxoprolinase [Armadillidium vulgare]|nr:5-oxoprolinase [Armadillidium vulgare]
MTGKFCFAIDRGGTFTDVYARCPNGKVKVLKLLSVDPTHYKDAPTEGIRRVLEQEMGSEFCGSGPIKTSEIDWIRMGTTVATNALLERKGERMALAITKGFHDLLHIGNQTRPDIFDLKVTCPDVLYEEVIEIEERIIPKQDFDKEEEEWEEVIGTTKESLYIVQKINVDDTFQKLKTTYEKGITSLSVLLIHSYMYPEHELIVKKIAEKVGFKHVSLSSYVMPMIKAVPRGFTACSDAYLTPTIKKYLEGFRSGFVDELRNVNVLFMQSDGGLTQMNSFNGSRAILSGPAGGVVGYAMTAYKAMQGQAIIGFDMGGTSTDVSRYAGKYEHVFESTTAGITIQAPQLDINTVAAGGGSCLFFRSGMFVVGPESAGAHPGPACYKKGGPLAVTDANLILGRLLPQYFPKIFGKKENEPLDRNASLKAIKKIGLEISSHPSQKGKTMTPEEIAFGFICVANESMCRPIRALTQAKGHDTSHHALAVFGGAGGQHACAIAHALGMSKIFVHKYAGILSAFGMALADVVHEVQEPCAKRLIPEEEKYLASRLQNLASKSREALLKQGFSNENIICEPFLNLRYEGTDFALMCTLNNEVNFSVNAFKNEFSQRYQNEFGFIIKDRMILVDDVRVRGIGKSFIDTNETFEKVEEDPVPDSVTDIYFENGYQKSKVFLFEELKPGHVIEGPSIIIDKLSTILVEPGCVATITDEKNIMIDVGKEKKDKLGTELNTIQLSIFAHRFMSLAEQMGRSLQRTSISTNIKERLDFSCAVFGPDGGLVSNAPHIPVHLGAMQETVQYQLNTIGDSLKNGDVILTNHPSAGGSHLPDLTVITPVFRRECNKPVFYVASRGHHADIGGITPGSMPPNSTSIFEEGAVFMSFKLVEGGEFQEKNLIEQLMEPGNIPGSSGSRNLMDNISDLKAQVAANRKGIQLVNELIDYYGLEVVQAYMKYIQDSAECAVRDLLKDVGMKMKKKTGKSELFAEDRMDDGSVIQLHTTINENAGEAIFDFSKTGPEVWGNCNAPRAITKSALIYCLRSLVSHDIPLNQGCLEPISVTIPKGCLLNPSPEAAVVGGNVQTSQRVVDVILKAFEACAASQGCMNNVTFGDETFGYYETVAGGSGAGPSWHGRSGVHTHMTNTRITDPEILERRYPIILKRFTLNPETGGLGAYRGGDGVIRELRFRKKMTLSILTERRVYAPYGLNGGEDGARGQNLLLRRCGKVIRLPSKASLVVYDGDTFRLESPGGGGYGAVSGKRRKESKEEGNSKKFCASNIRGSVFDFTKSQESA